jgi:O-antigen ligase/tetratricopeptide (TPR) repeat protein
MAFPDRVPRAVLVAFITVAACFAVLVASGSGSLESVSFRLIYDGMAVAVLVPWLALATVRPAWRPASRLMHAIAACLAAFVISSATSRYPRLSFEMLGYAVLIAELYLLLVAMMRRPFLRHQFERLALALCCVVCLLYLLEAIGLWQQWWSLVGGLTLPPVRPASIGLTYGSPNPVATVLLMLGTFGIGSIARHGRGGVGLAVVLVPLMAVAVLVSGSRGAWLGAAAGLAAMCAAAVVAFEPLRRRIRALAGSRWGGPAVVLLVMVMAGAIGAAAISGRLTTEGASYRAAFAAASLRMFEASPLVGVGPGTWQVLRELFTVSPEIDYYVPHAHDIYLMTFAEFGLVGVVAALTVFASIGQLVVRALRSGEWTVRLVGLAAVFTIVLFAAQQLVDVLVNVPGIMVAAALPIAWLDAAQLGDVARAGHAQTGPRAGRWQRMSAPLRRAAPAGAAAITCLIAIGLILIESVAVVADRSVAAAESGDWHRAAALAAQAASRDPGLNVYWYDLGAAAANSGEWQQADVALTRSATTDDFTYAWLDLAAVRWQLGDTAGARQALGRAERLGWQRAPLAFAAGWLRQQLGDERLATADYTSALVAAPLLAGDPYWSSTVATRSLWPSILASARQRLAGDAALQLDLSAGLDDAATAIAAQMARSDPRLYALVVPGWNGDPGALTKLVALAEDRPLDVVLATWTQVIALHRGDPAIARRFDVWLTITAGATSIPHVTFGKPQPVHTDDIDRYGSLYRRPVPQELVVNILPQLTWQSQP